MADVDVLLARVAELEAAVAFRDERIVNLEAKVARLEAAIHTRPGGP